MFHEHSIRLLALTWLHPTAVLPVQQLEQYLVHYWHHGCVHLHVPVRTEDQAGWRRIGR